MPIIMLYAYRYWPWTIDYGLLTFLSHTKSRRSHTIHVFSFHRAVDCHVFHDTKQETLVKTLAIGPFYENEILNTTRTR
jgi:hypothetical protein